MKNFKYLAALALVGGLAFCAPTRAFAQQDQDKVIPSLELEDSDIRDALKMLFRFTGGNYVVAQDVAGTVTLSIKEQTFDVVLRAILNQVNATFRVEGNIYYIINKPSETTGPAPTTDTGPQPTSTTSFPIRIKIRNADPALIIALLGQQYYTDPTGLFPETSSFPPGGGGGGGQNGGGFGGGGNGFGGGGSGFGGGGSGFGGGGSFGGGGFGGGGRSGGGGGGRGLGGR